MNPGFAGKHWTFKTAPTMTMEKASLDSSKTLYEPTLNKLDGAPRKHAARGFQGRFKASTLTEKMCKFVVSYNTW